MKKFILTAIVAATAIAGAAVPALADPYHGDNNRLEQRSDQHSFGGQDGRGMGGWQHRDWRGGDRRGGDRFDRYAGYHRGHSKACFHSLRNDRRG